jgi:hypothetical protein
MSDHEKVTKKALLLVWSDFVGYPHSDDAPWARAERTSMSWQRSRGIHAARPTARRLRLACTQVAIGGVWTIASEKQKQKVSTARILLIVPTLRVVTHRLTLRVDLDAERLAMHPHAERGNDHKRSHRNIRLTLFV